MAELIRSHHAKERYYFDTQFLRLELYRLVSAFFASRKFAQHLINDGAYRSLGSLAVEFQESEIVRVLTAVAIQIRILDDQLDELSPFKDAESIVGKLVPDTSNPRKSIPLHLREACNKIIHAKVVRFDTKDDAQMNSYLTPMLYLIGQKQKAEWKATLEIVKFAESIEVLID